MKKRTLLPLTLAAAFALAGCSGGGDAAPSSSPAAQNTAAGETTAAAETTSAAPTTEAAKPAGGQLSAQQLADIADTLAGDNEQAQIVDKQMIVSQLPMAEQQLKAMKIEPAECAQFVAADVNAEFEKMEIITVALPGETPLESTSISIASYKDPADANANISKAQSSLKDCSEFSIEMQGQKVTTKTTEVEAKTNGAVTQANRSEIQIPGGSMTTLAVSAQQENNLVSVSKTGMKATDADVAEAEKLTNKVLDLLNK